jgi:hypothetical protein
MKLKEKTMKYWEIWQNYEEKDLVYRVSLVVSGFIIAVLSLALVLLSLRAPLIISLNNGVPAVTVYSEDSDTVTKEEASVFIQNFVKHYYNWTPKTIEKSLHTALSYLDKPLKNESKSRIKEKTYDSKEKKLSQSVYVKDVKFNKKKLELTVSSERIFTISNVKLSSDFKVIFRLSKKKRSKRHPSGLLISEITEPFEQK